MASFFTQSDCSGLISYGSKPFYYVRQIRSWFCNSGRINSKRSDIDPMKTCDCFNPEVPRPRYFWRDNRELCWQVCTAVYTVFWPYLVTFEEIVADNSRWCLAKRVNVGFTDMRICFTVTLLPVPVCVTLTLLLATSTLNRPKLVESFFFTSLDESSPSEPTRTGLI